MGEVEKTVETKKALETVLKHETPKPPVPAKDAKTVDDTFFQSYQKKTVKRKRNLKMLNMLGEDAKEPDLYKDTYTGMN